jgi:hypothetical protein
MPALVIRLLTGIEPPDSRTMTAWGNAVGELAASDPEPRQVELVVQPLN